MPSLGPLGGKRAQAFPGPSFSAAAHTPTKSQVSAAGEESEPVSVAGPHGGRSDCYHVPFPPPRSSPSSAGEPGASDGSECLRKGRPRSSARWCVHRRRRRSRSRCRPRNCEPETHAPDQRARKSRPARPSCLRRGGSPFGRAGLASLPKHGDLELIASRPHARVSNWRPA